MKKRYDTNLRERDILVKRRVGKKNRVTQNQSIKPSLFLGKSLAIPKKMTRTNFNKIDPPNQFSDANMKT